jgi:hypothetical protein
MESDADFAMIAKDYGWKLSSWLPYSQPVFSAWQQKWFVIDELGNKMPTTPPSFLF